MYILEIHNYPIQVQYANGLTVNQDNQLEVSLGTGLQFDYNSAIEVTEGRVSGDTVAEGGFYYNKRIPKQVIKSLKLNPGAGLSIDPTTGALNATGGGTGTVYEPGEGISFTDLDHDDVT